MRGGAQGTAKFSIATVLRMRRDRQHIAYDRLVQPHTSDVKGLGCKHDDGVAADCSCAARRGSRGSWNHEEQ